MPCTFLVSLHETVCMNLPFFFQDQLPAKDGTISLNEDSSRHISQVLRMKSGALIRLTEGRGNVHTAEITKEHKKATEVKIISSSYTSQPEIKTTIAISLVKNNSRFEWFLEKATELGIDEIIPLLCTRTEKQHFRLDRMKNILVSAMLQSQQCWLPMLPAPVSLEKYLEQQQSGNRFIAHCMDGGKSQLNDLLDARQSSVVLIGPEGDFTPEELNAALSRGYQPVALGDTRLRTETAGIAAAVMMKLTAKRGV